LKRYKAQVSIEALAIIGVVVLGALVFASFYISNVNKNVDRLTDLDPDFTELLPGGPGGSFPGGPGGPGDPGNACGQPGACDPGSEASCNDGSGNSMVCTAECAWDLSDCIGGASCGDNYFSPGEECELVDDSYVFENANIDCSYNTPPGQFWTNTDTGEVSCTTCSYDFSACEYGTSAFRFLLILDPLTASANQNQPFLTTLSVDFDPEGTGVLSDYVDVSVTAGVFNSVLNSIVPTDKCTYDGTPIPATADGLLVKTFMPNESNVLYQKDISCSEDGVYFFDFKAVDNEGNDDTKQLEFTVPFVQSVYSLCREQTNPNGTADFCVNHFNAGETSATPDGEVTFYVNFPSAEEANAINAFSDAVCDGSPGGDQVCFSLGFD